MTPDNPNFSSSDNGQLSGSASGGPLGPDDGNMIINGSTNLAECICGAASDAYVQQVWVENYEGAQYHYKIHALGRGPSGIGNKLNLTFITAANEKVTLSLSSTTEEDHDVKCVTAGVIQMEWYVD
ncbi:MAG: hypothetical protein ABWY06_22040 [Pseudomonas sp.]|uniref:hypothetical protein n=1 Tax=Pseudomonas sp. TaxID=306 RepID=UPI0033927B26